MRDLHLWRLLRSKSLDSPEQAGLLGELAGLPLPERIPFLGLLAPALQHPDPGLRRAARGALAGAGGRPALQRLVGALGDGDESVRLAAIDALRRSVEGHDWARWAHALFHPDPVVRRTS